MGDNYQTEHLQACFRAAGLVPFTPEAVQPAQHAPSHGVGRPSVVPTSEVTAVLTVHSSETPIHTKLTSWLLSGGAEVN